MALSRSDRRQAAELVRRVLNAVDGGVLGADGPVAAAAVRRLEGAVMALDAIDPASPRKVSPTRAR